MAKSDTVQTMSESTYPRPFDEIRDRISVEESAQATEDFVELVEDTLIKHFDDTTTRQMEGGVAVTDLTLMAGDDTIESSLLKLVAIEGRILNSLYVTIAWQGERRGSSTAYYVGVENPVVIRRDSSSAGNVMKLMRLQEILGKSVDEASYDEIVAARVAFAQENLENYQFEREQQLNDLPVDADEIDWLADILMSAKVRRAAAG